MVRQKQDEKTKDLFAYADDNLKTTVVYKATNKINGEFYIGITRLSVEQRKYRHFVHARNGRSQHFYNAIRKYGEDAFSFVTLVECRSYREACARERQLIAELSPRYNKTEGGEGIVGHRHTAETRRKMSLAKAGRGPWLKGECPEHVREKLRVSARSRKGKIVVTEEFARRLASRGNEARRRPILSLADGLAFRSAREAAEHYGLKRSAVSFITKTGGTTTKPDRYGRQGLRFAYVRDVYAEQGAT